MDLIDGLKAFVATAQTGSFTEAAQRLGISNRLSSKYVAELETKIGARLLQRTTRKVGLTPSGQQLLNRAPALLDELDDLLTGIGEEAKGLSGVLRIAAPVTLGEIYIKGLLSRFAAIHPQLSIDLRLSDEHVDLASDGFDLAFRVGMPDVVTLKARKLFEFTSHLVASPNYLTLKGTPLRPDDLEAHTCIIDTNRRNATRWVFQQNGQEYALNPSRNLMVNSANIARDWAVEGCGVALCPNFVLHKELSEGKLVRLLENYQLPMHPLFAVYLDGNVLPRKVRALIDFAVEDVENNQIVTLPTA
ncbi:LysR family transcriptional regulator [Agarivorans aestuarii]|uniref:LysR family transcriptional regulator n=1 Tax=Agarivorans aestuarii TaxID=1563703 RepID=A0ABU7G420_9ALTE|nr:LysR family transcriptional regulator [Agarivorans aestuarii]MEE1673744.1 LysR family transcriptional regulator [Agarivorans aestuarii]